MKKSPEDYINYRVSKSDETFEDATFLASMGRWNSCVSRLYYSSFYLVNALLFKHRIKALTHKGIKTQFFLHFVNTNLINKEFGKLYSNLFVWRNDSDYIDFVDFDEQIVMPLLSKVADLNSKLSSLSKVIDF